MIADKNGISRDHSRGKRSIRAEFPDLEGFVNSGDK